MIRIVVRLYKNEIPLTEEKTVKMALSKLVEAPSTLVVSESLDCIRVGCTF